MKLLARTILSAAFVITFLSSNATGQKVPAQQTEIQKTESETAVTDSPKYADPISENRSGEAINWDVISSGGNVSTNGIHLLSGTIGQTAAGTSGYDNHLIHSGYWQDFSSGAGDCGDANASGYVDIDDIIYLVGYVFTGGPEPLVYDTGDTNCSGFIDIDDIIFLVGYVFLSGPLPCDIDGDGTPDC